MFTVFSNRDIFHSLFVNEGSSLHFRTVEKENRWDTEGIFDCLPHYSLVATRKDVTGFDITNFASRPSHLSCDIKGNTIGASLLWTIPSVPYVRINRRRQWIYLAFGYLTPRECCFCSFRTLYLHELGNYYMFAKLYTGETTFCVGLIGSCFTQNSHVATTVFWIYLFRSNQRNNPPMESLLPSRFSRLLRIYSNFEEEHTTGNVINSSMPLFKLHSSDNGRMKSPYVISGWHHKYVVSYDYQMKHVELQNTSCW